MKVSMIIPVYNEGQHLERFFRQLFELPLTFDREYVVIDDHSTDGSWDVIQKFAEGRSDIQIFRQPQNQGKGAALKKGFELATGEIILVQDADFEYDPLDLNELVKPIEADRADVVFGSRFRKTSPQVHRTFHYLVNRFLTLLSNFCSGLYLSDMETCYKVFKAEIIKSLYPSLEADRFGFEPEITAYLAKLKLRVHEYPISYYPRGYLEGKKINWRDGVAAVWYILKFNFRPLPTKAKESMPNTYHLGAEGRWL